MKIHISLLLFALGACAVPQANSGQPASGLQVGARPQAAPKNYTEWIGSLPQLSADSTAFRTSAQGKVAMHVQEEGMALDFDIQLGVKLEYQDLRNFREDIWLHVEMPDLPQFVGFEKIDMAIKVLADGQQLYLTPEFQDDALGAQVKAAGIGIEGMTLTLKIKIFEELMQIYWHTLKDADVDLSTFLPEGMSVDEFFEHGLNPAGWARAYMLTSDILDFRVNSTEVRIKARMKDNLFGDNPLLDPGQLQQLQDLTYEMSFDRYSGLPTSASMRMEVDDAVSMVFELDFAEFEMGSDLFAAKHFNSDHIDRSHLFPIDTFVQMALASMQAGIVEEDDDMAF
jgi:hypothetical protein